MSVKLAKHKDFDALLEAITPEERIICLRLRNLLLDNFPGLRETWAYGAPFYKGKSRICFFYPSSLPYSGIESGVNLGFAKGYLLSNVQGLVKMGERKEVGYVHLTHSAEARDADLLEILQEAVILDELGLF